MNYSDKLSRLLTEMRNDFSPERLQTFKPKIEAFERALASFTPHFQNAFSFSKHLLKQMKKAADGRCTEEEILTVPSKVAKKTFQKIVKYLDNSKEKLADQPYRDKWLSLQVDLNKLSSFLRDQPGYIDYHSTRATLNILVTMTPNISQRLGRPLTMHKDMIAFLACKLAITIKRHGIGTRWLTLYDKLYQFLKKKYQADKAIPFKLAYKQAMSEIKAAIAIERANPNPQPGARQCPLTHSQYQQPT